MDLGELQLNPALLSPPSTPLSKNGLNMQRIDETAREFESMFLSEMLKPMFDTVDVDENFGGGRGEEVFRSFLRDEYSKLLTETRSLGIAAQVKEELIKMQEEASRNKLAQNVQGTLSGETGAIGATPTKQGADDV